MLLNKKHNFFFVGIGGSGMFPLAMLLKKNGYTVAGSDKKENKSIKRLDELGTPIFLEHSAKNIQGSDVIVFSSAIPHDNEELIAAKNLNKIILHRSDLLKELVNKKPSITIAGTHGKTTSTAFIHHLLNSNSERSSLAILGGTSTKQEDRISLEDCEFIIAEADESDGSFLKYKPDVAVLTNIEQDHLDYFHSYENIIEHFKQHLSNLKGLRRLVYNEDDPSSKKLASIFTGKKISFGFSKKADIYAEQITANGEETRFIVSIKGKKEHLTLPLIGKHNILNTLAAISLVEVLEKPVKSYAQSVKSSPSVKRRLQLIYQKNDLLFYDDYAHNPGKIKAALEALRDHFPDHKIIALFEPHRFSRIDALFEGFIQSFQASDFVLIFPTFCAGEEEATRKHTEQDLANGIKTYSHKKAEAVYNVNRAYERLIENVTDKTVISSLGAGNISHIAYQMREKIICENSLLKGAP